MGHDSESVREIVRDMDVMVQKTSGGPTWMRLESKMLVNCTFMAGKLAEADISLLISGQIAKLIDDRDRLDMP